MRKLHKISVSNYLSATKRIFQYLFGILLVAFAANLMSSATASDSSEKAPIDPAIQVCSIFTLKQLPKSNEYIVVSATIEKSDVSLMLRSSRGLPIILTRVCHFTADGSDGKFRLARIQTAESKKCMAVVDQITDLIRSGSLHRAKKRQTEIEKCNAVLKRELSAEANFLGHSLKLLEIPGYPINPNETALQ